MKTLTQILARLAAYAGVSAIGAATPLLIAGNADWWMAAIGAAVPHTAMIVTKLLTAYSKNGKVTQAEIDSTFGDAAK